MIFDKIVISLDVMGGANAPLSTLEGAKIALASCGNLQLLLYGDRVMLTPHLKILDEFAGRFELVHTTCVITDEEQPVNALRFGKDSSMRRAIDAVKDGLATAVVSAGNTGALMVMAKIVLGDLPGIKRPAIISSFPSKKGHVVLLDLGANSECDEVNLLQFAVMGDCYAKIILQNNKPSLGLLNMGVESHKGAEIHKKAHELLTKSKLNYKGYVEGNDIAEGTVDVVITDGFSGNVLLKSVEGYAKLLLDAIRSSFNKNWLTKISGLLIKKHLRESLHIFDPNEVNGAMLIGIGGIVVKSHGSSHAKGIASSIMRAYDLSLQNINQSIKKELDEHLTKGTLSLVNKIKKTLGLQE